MKEKTINELRLEAISDVLPMQGKYGDNYLTVECNADVSGEDVFIEIEPKTDDPAKEILNAIKERIDGFSIDEYLETYASMRGKSGVPSTYEDLIDAGNECLDLYKEWYNDGTKALKNVERNQKEVLAVLVENTENGKSEWLKMPTTKEAVRDLYEKIGIKEVDTGNPIIKSFESKIDELEKIIHTRYLSNSDNLNELNYCINILTDKNNEIDSDLLNAAILFKDGVRDVKDLINLTQNLDCYTLLKGVTEFEDYGRYLVEQRKSIKIPEDIKPYFNYAEYGESMYELEPTLKTDKGIIFQEAFAKLFYKGIEDIPEEYKVFPSPTLKKTKDDKSTSLAKKFEEKQTENPSAFSVENKKEEISKNFIK